MPKIGSNCKECNNQIQIWSLTNQGFKFCSKKCLNIYKHKKSGKCCIHNNLTKYEETQQKYGDSILWK